MKYDSSFISHIPHMRYSSLRNNEMTADVTVLQSSIEISVPAITLILLQDWVYVDLSQNI